MNDGKKRQRKRVHSKDRPKMRIGKDRQTDRQTDKQCVRVCVCGYERERDRKKVCISVRINERGKETHEEHA